MADHADDVKQSIFGVSDGLTSSLGVVIPLALAHKSMVTVIVGLAICAAIGMGGGEFLSDERGSRRSALFMAVATFVGTILPAVPFWITSDHWIAVPASVALCTLSAIVIAQTRVRDSGKKLASYVQTFGILLVASAVTIAFTFATGAAG